MAYAESPQAEPELLGYQDADGVSRARTLVSLLGPATAAHAAALHSVAQRVIALGRRPVICISGYSRDLIVDGTLAVELLPGRSDLPILSQAEYAAYVRRRWDILLAKWQITEEITLGQTLDSFLATEAA